MKKKKKNTSMQCGGVAQPLEMRELSSDTWWMPCLRTPAHTVWLPVGWANVRESSSEVAWTKDYIKSKWQSVKAEVKWSLFWWHAKDFLSWKGSWRSWPVRLHSTQIF
jgi:hypothetical protein